LLLPITYNANINSILTDIHIQESNVNLTLSFIPSNLQLDNNTTMNINALEFRQLLGICKRIQGNSLEDNYDIYTELRAYIYLYK